MKVAIASGKGGTGKTMVTASLATLWQGPLVTVDLDVEEPNLHLFLKPHVQGEAKAYMEVPKVDERKCNYCGDCAALCQFKAISVAGPHLLLFPEMCHGCGGCLAVCPQQALTPDRRELGDIQWGTAGKIDFVMGRLRVGEAMSPPLMHQVKAQMTAMAQLANADVIIDAPPGISCPAMNAVMDADVIVLVTEPTPFGLYDMTLAHEAFAPLQKPLGVVVNRAGLGDDHVYDYCRSKGLPIWAQIPYSRQIAAAYAEGRIVAQTSNDLKTPFLDLHRQIMKTHLPCLEVPHV
jgi:MinD superfamily P-loop ATPase